MSGKIQSDFIEKRFGQYRKLSVSKYFATERQFIEAEKAIRVKSLIKFSKYSIKDVGLILKVDKNEIEKNIISHSETVMDIISEDIDSDGTHMDNNIIFYVAGFVAKSLKKQLKCTECSNALGSNEEISIPQTYNLPDDCDAFLNSINRGGLIKPSDIIFSLCIVSWKVYKLTMDNTDSKSYFLSCKSQRPVFVKCILIYIKDNESYDGILKATCILEHSFEEIVKGVAEKFFNVMAKNFVSEVNSITHSNRKRKMDTNKRSNEMKINKLQSEN